MHGYKVQQSLHEWRSKNKVRRALALREGGYNITQFYQIYNVFLGGSALLAGVWFVLGRVKGGNGRWMGN